MSEQSQPGVSAASPVQQSPVVPSGTRTGNASGTQLHLPVANTIDAPAAATTDWDVVVIGAGPAGALAATLLARRGLRTLLIERRTFPRYKVCGACLNPLSLGLLHAAKLDHVVADALPLTHFCLQSAGGSLRLDLPGSVSLSREQFDARLTQAAIDAGAAFLSGCSAKVLPLDTGSTADGVTPPHRSVELDPGTGRRPVVRGAVVIAADGLSHGSLSRLPEFRSVVLAPSRLGAGTVVADAPEFFTDGCIYMASGRGGYVGLVRLEDGRLNVAAALDASAVEANGGLGATACRILEFAGFPPVPELAAAEWSGTPALTRSTRPLASQRVFVIGDAAGYVEPFTGEGIAWALASATSVAELVQRASTQWDAMLERQWNDEWQRTVGRHLGWCRRLARLLRHPGAVAAVTRIVGTCPWLARPVLNRINRMPEAAGMRQTSIAACKAG